MLARVIDGLNLLVVIWQRLEAGVFLGEMAPCGPLYSHQETPRPQSF
jgi:hypothetical protein